MSVSRTHYLFGESTMNLLGVLWFTMNFREITMNSLFFSRVYYEFTFLSTNSLSFRENAMNILYFSLFHNGFTVCFANSLSFSWIHYGLTIFHANLLWIHSLSRIDVVFHEFTISSLIAKLLWIHRLFHDFTMNSFASLIFTIFLADSAVCIYY